LAYARHEFATDLFDSAPDLKVSDDFLKPLFARYFNKLGLSENLMHKTNYHVLAGLVPKQKMAAEVIDKLDAIVAVAKMAKKG
jgi:hypothetical protein